MQKAISSGRSISPLKEAIALRAGSHFIAPQT
jgi:hypothetical protein